jgi:hypothetical protein
MPASDLRVETRIGTKRKPRRILSIVSNTTELKGFPVGFFAEEMTRIANDRVYMRKRPYAETCQGL